MSRQWSALSGAREVLWNETSKRVTTSCSDSGRSSASQRSIHSQQQNYAEDLSLGTSTYFQAGQWPSSDTTQAVYCPTFGASTSLNAPQGPDQPGNEFDDLVMEQGIPDTIPETQYHF